MSANNLQIIKVYFLRVCKFQFFIRQNYLMSDIIINYQIKDYISSIICIDKWILFDFGIWPII